MSISWHGLHVLYTLLRMFKTSWWFNVLNLNQTCFNQCGACIWFGGLGLLVLASIPISENWIEISLIFGSILELELELKYVNKWTQN
jgi:hypothetical protein